MPPDPRPVLGETGIVPVLTLDSPQVAVAVGIALQAGGLSAVEVTLRTPSALACIRALRSDAPGIVVGAGTATSPRDIDAAVEAGAAFIVTPGTPADLAAALEQAPIPVLPGCATASEAMTLAARGFSVLKFFPAEASGGVRWLQSIAGPLPGLAFCPTGGIDASNAASYLALPNVIAVGGSWVAPGPALAAGDFAAITELARQAACLKR